MEFCEFRYLSALFSHVMLVLFLFDFTWNAL